MQFSSSKYLFNNFRKVTEVAHEQMETLWHTTNVYQHPKLCEYAEELTSTLPSYLNVNENYFLLVTRGDASVKFFDTRYNSDNSLINVKINFLIR